MLTMLIDTREPPPPPPVLADVAMVDFDDDPPPPRRRRHWELSDWRGVLYLAAGVLLALISSLLPPLPAYVVILGACVLIGHGLGGVVRNTPGLKDHRQ